MCILAFIPMIFVLYGYYPSDEVIKDRLQLKPVMTLKTRIAHINFL